MNKNLLIIAAAAVGYALLRPKTTATTNTTASVPAGGGANTYVPQQATAGSNTAGNWLNTAGGLITGASGLVTQGATAWGQISGALGIKPPVKAPAAPATASIVADASEGTWAGHITYSTDES